jgi:hypothetical protein
MTDAENILRMIEEVDPMKHPILAAERLNIFP